MKVLVCGDRDYDSPKWLWAQMDKLHADYGFDTLIHGCARGADTMAGEWAEEIEIGVQKFPAQWSKFGRAAGPIRNRQMLDEKPSLVVAFHDNLKESKGTKDCVEEARRRGIKVVVRKRRRKI